jgi:hypothetical protein
MRPIHIRAFVPIKSKPTEILEDRSLPFIHIPLNVCVLNPQDEDTT